MSTVKATLVIASLTSGLMGAQNQSEQWQVCPVLAELPTDSSAGLRDTITERERFEIRECYGEYVTVCMFEHKAKKPSFVFNTDDGYPRYLLQTFNLLVFQSAGGSADHVYVFAFQAGKPVLAWKTATKSLIQAEQKRDSLTVMVEPSTFPGQKPRPVQSRKFMFEIPRVH